MQRFFIFLYIAVAVLARGSKVHEQMTPEEVQALFGTKRDEVPSYEVVPVAHTVHRSSVNHRIVQLKSFEREMTLYLEPTDGYLAGVKTPVFRARSNASAPSGVEFERVPGAIKTEHNFFQDPFNLAALVIKDESNGKPTIDGMIDDLAIRPLPKRLRGQFRRDKRSARDEFLKSNRSVYHPDLEDTHHHIVFRVPSNENTGTASESATPKRGKRSVPVQDSQKLGNDIPGIIHPQILIILESSLFVKKFDQKVENIIDYVLSYWNAVDLRYRVFRQPNVRLNIAGIVLAEDHNVTPYIAKNHVHIPKYEGKIDVVTALRNKSQFFFPETIYNDEDKSLKIGRLGLQYDIVITMTPFDMCEFNTTCLSNGKYTCDDTSSNAIENKCTTLGFAYYTGACAYDPKNRLMEAVGIVEDVGGFNGIIPTAHEVGHLMGASHSQNKIINTCPRNDGYIMSYELFVTDKSFTWSACSGRSIQRFLKTKERAQCLFNKPETGTQAPRLLPGKVFSLDEQCDRIMKTHSCKTEPNTCTQLSCMDTNQNECTKAPEVAVPEGSPCGQGLHCINGKCIKESSNKVLLKFGTES